MTAAQCRAVMQTEQQRTRHLRKLGDSLLDAGYTVANVGSLIRGVREQQWRACEPNCDEAHGHRAERLVEIDDRITVSWEALSCYEESQSQHCSPGSRRTYPGEHMRPLPSDVRAWVVDDLAVQTEGELSRDSSSDVEVNIIETIAA